MSQEARTRRQRRQLHFDALIQRVRSRFEAIPDSRRCPSFSLADTLMAGLALFSLKDPSLLAFMHRAVDHNLRRVFGLQAVPSDTQMRTILDDVDPDRLRPAFRDVFRQLQRARPWSRMSSSKAVTWWRWTASNPSGPRRSTAIIA